MLLACNPFTWKRSTSEIYSTTIGT